MYKDVLRTIAGIEVFPLLSLAVFVVFFAVMLLWVMRLDEGRLARQASIPLDEDDAAPPVPRDPSAPGALGGITL
jgi:cytochrome c oxidase cbb3-type subunit IV